MPFKAINLMGFNFIDKVIYFLMDVPRIYAETIKHKKKEGQQTLLQLTGLRRRFFYHFCLSELLLKLKASAMPCPAGEARRWVIHRKLPPYLSY